MRTMADCGLRIAESAEAPRRSACADKSAIRNLKSAIPRHSAIRNPQSAIPARRAVTLVELLITMTILAILGAAILGTASAAMEAGRRSKTQTTINKIHGLIMERWASYETRRVPIHQNIAAAINSITDQRVRGQILADARLLALRELMKKEMPDRWEDVVYVPQILQQAPPLAHSYLTRYQQASSHPEIGANESAECLYLVVMLATGDGEARTHFTKQEIGDVDDDGMPEIVDGWGNPIDWIRWPAGVVSDLQPINPDGSRVDHDPFDVYQRDLPVPTPSPHDGNYPTAKAFPAAQPFNILYAANIRNRLTNASLPAAQRIAFRLTPLIFSGGPDGGSALKTSNDLNPPIDAVLDPYVVFDGFQEGAPDPTSDLTTDNITNHLIDY